MIVTIVAFRERRGEISCSVITERRGVILADGPGSNRRPCLQSIGAGSIRSIHYYQLPTFPTNRETCFVLIVIPNGMVSTREEVLVGGQRSDTGGIGMPIVARFSPARRWRDAKWFGRSASRWPTKSITILGCHQVNAARPIAHRLWRSRRGQKSEQRSASCRRFWVHPSRLLTRITTRDGRFRVSSCGDKGWNG
jgi:hypothetical protein